MANLEVVDRISNDETGTLTLVVRDQDNPDDLGAYYHYAAKPPAHAELSAEQWADQVAGHALALEARSRGVEPPAAAHPDPGQLGAAASPPSPAGAELGPDESRELEQLRAEQAATRERVELENLRAARREQPTA